ncbi:hypothetical protein [Klebsiella variicola]|uniref:hypothetical protein n=1 Tax=Klebsiella variicola TaxID=244366 RepID=UPI002287D111|nr:hypothetical protein [Klebsiella variicola]
MQKLMLKNTFLFTVLFLCTMTSVAVKAECPKENRYQLYDPGEPGIRAPSASSLEDLMHHIIKNEKPMNYSIADHEDVYYNQFTSKDWMYAIKVAESNNYLKNTDAVAVIECEMRLRGK